MQIGLDHLAASLARNDLLVPYLEATMASEEWPRLPGTLDLHERSRSGYAYFHPSTHPLMSDRELYYRFHPHFKHLIVEEKPSRRQRFTFDVGTVVGALIQHFLVQVGLATEDDLEAQMLDHEHHVSARGDAVVTHPREGKLLCEIKTQNSRSFALQRAIKPAWKAQLQLTMAGLGLTKGVLLVCELGYPYDMKEFYEELDPEYVGQLHAKFDRVRAAIVANVAPPHCCEQVSGTAVKRCGARGICFPGKP